MGRLIDEDDAIRIIEFECGEWTGLAKEISKQLKQLLFAQDIIRCKDCDWWTKQEDSLQGRCDRYGMYPTGYWYCAGARERREE